MLFACCTANVPRNRYVSPVGRSASSSSFLELTMVPPLADASAGGVIVFFSQICTAFQISQDPALLNREIGGTCKH